MKTKILTTLLLFHLVGYGQANIKRKSTNTSKPTIAGWNTFNGSNYTVQYPVHWELNKSGLMGSSFFLFSPLAHEKDPIRENVNLLIQDLSHYNIDLDQFVEITKDQVRRMITNSALEESTRIKRSNTEFHKMIYTGDQGEYRLKFEQYFWVMNKKAYILTFTCEDAQFPEYQEIGEKILNSFQLMQ